MGYVVVRSLEPPPGFVASGGGISYNRNTDDHFTLRFSPSSSSTWAKSFKFSQSSSPENAQPMDGRKSPFGRLASGFSIRSSSKNFSC